MTVCVFCGSRPGGSPVYARAAAEVGRALAVHGVHIVYGGSTLGAMGALASAAAEAGGEVTAVIPRFMHEKVDHPPLANLYVVDTMHQRKKLMCDLSSAFIALPGGLGTMEELLEMMTWAQLKLHPHPLALLNVEGYYDSFLDFLKHAVKEGFVDPRNVAVLQVAESPEEIVTVVTTE